MGSGRRQRQQQQRLMDGRREYRFMRSVTDTGPQVDPLMNEESVRKSFADMNEPVDYVRVMRPKEGSNFGYEVTAACAQLPFCCVTQDFRLCFCRVRGRSHSSAGPRQSEWQTHPQF